MKSIEVLVNFIYLPVSIKSANKYKFNFELEMLKLRAPWNKMVGQLGQ